MSGRTASGCIGSAGAIGEPISGLGDIGQSEGVGAGAWMAAVELRSRESGIAGTMRFAVTAGDSETCGANAGFSVDDGGRDPRDGVGPWEPLDIPDLRGEACGDQVLLGCGDGAGICAGLDALSSGLVVDPDGVLESIVGSTQLVSPPKGRDHEHANERENPDDEVHDRPPESC